MKTRFHKLTAWLLTVAMLMTFIPSFTLGVSAADETPTEKNITLGTSALKGGQASNVYFGTYQQSSLGNTEPTDGTNGVDWIKSETATQNGQGAYYSKDPIKWRVLSNADGKAFLLSDKNLDVVRYHEDHEAVTWETSTIRFWLNDNFINAAFGVAEKGVIADTTVVNDDNPLHNTEGGNNTTDKVFLLSFAEAGNTSYFAHGDTRLATNTAYVAGGGEIGTTDMNSVGEVDYWWLRSPGAYDYRAAVMHYGGGEDPTGYYVDNDEVAVRPAFNLNLSSVLFTSAAEDGKQTGFNAVEDYSGNEYKLTLKDSSRSFEVSDTTAKTVITGEKISFTYTGAETGANEYISAMLVDGNNEILYYGTLASVTSDSDTVEIIVPSDIAAGTYTLKLFNEQINGDYKTDYASDFEDIALTVEVPTPEAKWGASKDNLTNEGTLANAIAAAQNDSSIKYILMIDDVSVQGLVIDGGEFTLDMGGKTLECERQIRINDGKIVFKNGTFESNFSNTIWVEGDIDTTEITFESGTYSGSSNSTVVYVREAKQLTVMKDVTIQGDIPIIIGSDCAASLIQGATLSGTSWDISCFSGGDNKITEGIYDFDFYYGSLDLTNHPDPTGITIVDFDSSMWGDPIYVEGIKLPDGYGLFDIRGIQHTEMGTTYPGKLTVKPLHQHNYTYTASNNVLTETCTCEHSETATITAPENPSYDGTAKEATVVYSDNWQGGELTISYSVGGNINAGIVRAAIEKDGETAIVEYEIKKVKIEKPTSDTTRFVYDGNEHIYNIAANNNYTIYDNKRTNAGTQTVRVTLNDKTNFEWTDGTTIDMTFDFIVNKKPIELVWDITEFVYNGEEKTVTAEVSNAVSGDTVNLTVTDNKATDVGNYTAKVTALDNPNYTLEGVTTTKVWSILQSGTEFAVKKVLNGDTETNSFTYGDTITVKIKPQATGTTPTTMMLMSVTSPTENQMALYIEDTQISEAVAADGDGYYTMTIDTTTAGLAYGEITLTAKYVGNANMAGNAENVRLTLQKADATLGNAPIAKTDLIYNSAEQTLIDAGSEFTGGTLMYKLNDGEYSAELPKATDAGTYTIYYKVFGDTNHNDTAEQQITVTIAEKTINPAIELTAPVANAAPQTTIETDGYTASVVWSPEVTDKFAYSTAYTATITLTPKTNYTVTGITENGYTVNGTESVTNTADSGNITAVYAETGRRPSSGGGTTRYTVKFDTDSGSNVASKTVARNSKVAEPTAPTKDGYTFNGWYTDKELTKPYDFETKVTKSFTLYAKWDKHDDETDDKTDDKTDTPTWKNPFTDVNADDWYYENVEYAVENGLFNGTTETTFAPNGIITRAMMVTVLYRAEGEPTVTGTATFEDVDSDAYYANAVVWGQQNGIIKGYSETEFAPDQNITREQIAAIMFRYAQYKEVAPTGAWAIRLDYADLEEIADYAAEGVMYCTLKEIMQGKGNNTFAPKDNATRAEIAAILHRFIEADK